MICLLHLFREVYHGQSLFFGSSGTDLRLRWAGALGACRGAAVWCQCGDCCAFCGEAAKHREGGDVAAKPQGRPPGWFGKRAPHLDFPVDIVRAEPDITLKELAAALSGTEGVQVQLSSLHLSSLHRALKRAGLSYKKGLIAAERDRPALRLARREWIMRRQPRMRREPHRLVFIDETAVKTNLTRLRGRAPVGERLYGVAPFGKWGTQTFIAGLTQTH